MLIMIPMFLLKESSENMLEKIAGASSLSSCGEAWVLSKFQPGVELMEKLYENMGTLIFTLA